MSTPTTATCDTCDEPLPRPKQSRTSPPRARYCSNACRQRSYRLRQQSGGVEAALGGGPLTQLSSFVGRTDELVELTRLLHEVRLLTLTGPAGVGKSRLALELAGQEARGRRCEVSVVKLGGITGSGEIRQRILAALDEVRDADDGVGPADRNRLLVLDDCEHVLDSCGALLTELLPGRPRLRVLATSREPLRLPGESVFSVTGLALSDPDSDHTLADCLRSDAVTLFMDRARAVAPDFQLNRDNAEHVEEICVRLDGLPLPIEMAARLIRVFPPAEIRSRLHDRLALLTNGWRLADDRHQSLRASLEWGYGLLSPVEQALLRRLSVLPGGFGPAAAAAVTADVPEAAGVLPEILVALESKSVITTLTRTGGPTRFGLLESMHCFGQERLVAEDEDAGTYERLVAWLTAMSLPVHSETVVSVATLERLEAERVNLAHAVDRLGSGSDERQLLLAGALAAVEVSRGQGVGVAGLVEHALERTAPDSVYRGVALEAMALASRDTEPERAAQHADEAVRVERGRGPSPLLGRLLLVRGTIRQTRDEREASLSDLEESLEIGLRLRHDTLAALSLGMIARHQVENGELGSAEREIERVLPVLRRRVAPRWLSTVLVTAGALALEKDDLAQAEEYFTESLRGGTDLHADAARALEGLALVAARGYRFDRGLRLLGAAERVRGGGQRASRWWRQRVRATREAALRALPAGRADTWLEAGRALPWRQVLSLALGDDTAGPRDEGAAHPLSLRERDVTALVVEGLTNRQIAARIHVSVRTVETHIRHIRTTLGLRSRAHIAAWAARQRPGSPAVPVHSEFEWTLQPVVG
ncbi:ATP-binding protein [Streptomyces sp. NPDC059092]|uniref:ATP-binding protein n=1 Tax=Streptomyces sp. NPDC059092 TaxID=3346725 RepID=UPI0036BE0796